LTRKEGERIFLNPGRPDQVVITLVRIDGTTAKIGIQAPDDVLILREEIVEAIDRERRNGGGN
jgi:carbon storage regulator CsrA